LTDIITPRTSTCTECGNEISYLGTDFADENFGPPIYCGDCSERLNPSREAEWDALTADQLNRACTRGSIIGLPLRCEFCEEAAVWSTGDYNPRVACYDLRHIAMAESIGSAVPPELLLDAVLVGLGQVC
jgi:hypothetical protein